MLSSLSKGRASSGRELRRSLLATVMLVLLPKIDVAFPNRRRKGVIRADDMCKEERKMVLWEDRRIVLFDRNLFLPTVSIELPRSEADAAGAVADVEADALLDVEAELDLPDLNLEHVNRAGPEDAAEHLPMTDLSMTASPEEPGPPDHLLPNEEGITTVEPSADTPPSLESLDHGSGKLEESNVVESAALHVEEVPLVLDGPMESISGGALVLVEGEKGKRARELMQQISLGILENGRSVTYVTTSQSVQDLVMEMFGRDERIATYLPDHRLLCVPVYPLIEGRGTRDGLLDKLMGSEQLQTSDVLIIDSLSDFLGDRFEEAICIRVLEFVQNLNGMGKAVFLVVNDGQKGILPLRLESELQLSLPSGEDGTLQMKRYQHAHQGAAEMLRFQVHPKAGLVAHPLPTEPQ